MFEIHRNISADNIEPTYNHVHHATALHLLEEGRLAYLEHIGFPNPSLIAKGLFLVITRIEVDYGRELHRGTVRITVDSGWLDGKRMGCKQTISCVPGKRAIAAKISFAVLDRALGRAIEPPEDLASAFLAGLEA